MSNRILHVVTNVSHYSSPEDRTGLWLSELTHAWEVFATKGYEQTIMSPNGGKVPLEPRSMKWPNLDATAKAWLADPSRMQMLDRTISPDQLNGADFDAIYFTGGHAVMYDFLEDPGLHRVTREVFERGGIVVSVCHGFCGLLNVRLSDDSLLIAGRKLTGFAWIEEVLAGVAKKVPYNAEAETKRRGGLYSKGLIPFTPYVVTDGRLVTGQNPQSAKATAKRVVDLLSERTST
ncbi:MAG TPA: type 1 glutamine amidotransferase domain-containing protein [Fontimonas sp.]